MPVSLTASILVLGLERVCLWPRIFFVSLASSLISSTPTLTITLKFEQLTKLFEQKNKPSLQFWPIQVSILVHSIIGNNNKTPMKSLK